MNVTKNLRLAFPLALNAILVQSMMIVDLMLISHLGIQAVAALGIATAITLFLLGIQLSWANGTQLILSRSVGTGDITLLKSQFRVGLSAIVLLSLGLAIALLLANSFFIDLLTQSKEVSVQAHQYLVIVPLTLLVSGIAQVAISLFNAQGQAQISLKGYLIEIPINVVISYCLINGIYLFPELSLQGAAIGSLVAVTIRALYLIGNLTKIGFFNASITEFKVGLAALHSHVLEASPIAANYIVLSTGMLVYQMLFARLDIIAFAAIVLILPWLRVGGQVSTAWAQATSIHVGQLIGRGNTKTTRLFIAQMNKITLYIAILLAFLYVIFGFIAELIYPMQAKSTLTILLTLIPIAVVLTFLRTINTSLGQQLRVLGRSKEVLLVHLVTQWLIAIPACVILLTLQVNVLWVFSILAIEEALKTFPFRRLLAGAIKAT